MAHVTVAEVQAWLDPDKIDLADNDTLPEEEHVSNFVLSRLAQVFDTSGWTNSSNTPMLVKTIISGITAGRRYNKVYSETEDAGNRYANKIEAIMTDMLGQVIAGTLTLIDVETGNPPAQVTANNPIFWPNDLTGALEVFDATGRVVQPVLSQDVKFRVGMEF